MSGSPSSIPKSPSRKSTTPPPLLAVALGLFAIGLLAIVAMFVILYATDSEPGFWLYVGAMLCPLGFVLAIVFTLRSGRRARP